MSDTVPSAEDLPPAPAAPYLTLRAFLQAIGSHHIDSEMMVYARALRAKWANSGGTMADWKARVTEIGQAPLDPTNHGVAVGRARAR